MNTRKIAAPTSAATRLEMADSRMRSETAWKTTVWPVATDEVVADTRTVADQYRTSAVATGQTVVFQAVSDRILESAISSLVAALVGAAIFLVFIYLVLEGTATLGLANVFPVMVTVTLVAGSMRALSVPFNTITATILAIVIGLGIDYSVHIFHRFVDERKERALVPALERTVTGTGGALFGSMLTTVSGIGVLSLAVFVAIQQFGLITALAVFYAFLTAVIVSPSVLVATSRASRTSTPWASRRSTTSPTVASPSSRDIRCPPCCAQFPCY